MAYLSDWQFVRPFCISTHFNASQLSAFAQLANYPFAIIDIAGVRGVTGNISEIAILKLQVRIPPCSSTKSNLN